MKLNSVNEKWLLEWAKKSNVDVKEKYRVLYPFRNVVNKSSSRLVRLYLYILYIKPEV